MPKKWPVETDLAKLKSQAQVFLMLDIQPTKMSPLVVKHPFTDNGITGIRDEHGKIVPTNLLEDSNSLDQWRRQLSQIINKADTPFSIFMMITNSYQLAFLKYAAPYLSEQDAALFLSQAWIGTESPNNNPNLSKRELLSMFRSIDPQKLMDEKEYQTFQRLNDTVTVYRGVTPYNAKNIKALSWTLDRDTAEWFAHRFGQDGTVYEAQISKAHICAVFLGRDESEVIVDPKHLLNLSQAQEQTMGGMEMM